MILMIEIIKAIALGFTIGVSAALIPGPMMFATIGISLEKGWRTGPLIFLGHSLVEISIIFLIIGGVSSFIGRSTIAYMSILGGIIMILFGLVILKSAKTVSKMDLSRKASKIRISKNPVFAGVLTSGLNPTFVLWWLTAGSAIILQEYLIGTIAIIAFVLGHWMADLGFLVTVSSSTSRGKEFISQDAHKRILYLCGSFMMIFGFWFIFNYNDLSMLI